MTSRSSHDLLPYWQRLRSRHWTRTGQAPWVDPWSSRVSDGQNGCLVDGDNGVDVGLTLEIRLPSRQTRLRKMIMESNPWKLSISLNIKDTRKASQAIFTSVAFLTRECPRFLFIKTCWRYALSITGQRSRTRHGAEISDSWPRRGFSARHTLQSIRVLQ